MEDDRWEGHPRGDVMRTDLYWIEGPWPGRLAVMPRPRGGDWLEDEVRAWRRAGVGVVLSLLTPEERAELDLAGEGELCRAGGIEFVSFPVADRCVPPSAEAFARQLTRLAEHLAGGRGVAVHCRQGTGRAGLVAIGLLIRSGVEPAAAIRQVSAARGCPVPETPEQSRWIADLARSLAAEVPKGACPPHPGDRAG